MSDTSPTHAAQKGSAVVDQIPLRSRSSKSFIHNGVQPPRSSSSMTAEDLLLGAALPLIGAINPQIPGGGREPSNAGQDEPHGIPIKGIPLSPTIEVEEESPKPLPPCDPIPIKFADVSVDVKVQVADPEQKEGFVSYILSRTGLGGGGPMVDKRILYNLSGTIKPKRLVALMGASGAGKSTLLNVLSSRLIPSEGMVTFANVPATETVVQSCSAFVQQLDLFINYLNVHEHLYAQIRLRLPELKTKEERLAREDMICNNLSLVKCRYNQIGTESGIGGISGGERKRLNVASELVTGPTVLFADEPTTGLDSFMAESVVKVLRQLSESGRTVIATVHQPSSKIFDLFHEVLLLAEGRMVYFGDRLGCIEWFKRLGFECPPYTNPADFIIKVISMPEQPDLKEKKLETILEWSNKWKNEGVEFLKDWNSRGRERFISDAQNFAEATINATASPDASQIMGRSRINSHASDINRFKLPDDVSKDDDPDNLDVIARRFDTPKQAKLNWFKQVAILYQRAMNANRRDKFLVHARAAQTIVLACVFGFLIFRLDWSFDDSITRVGGAYIVLMNQSMAGAFSVINTFVYEKPVIRREYEGGLISPTAYITAKMLADVPVQIVFPILFAIITYWLMGLNDDFGSFMIYIVILLLVANAAMSVGYFASAIAPGADIAAVICNLAILPLTVFGGLMVKLSDSPVWLSWIQWLSFIRYGFENGLVTLFRGKTIESPVGPMSGLDFVHMRTGFNDHHYGLWFLMLAILLVAYRAISVFSFAAVLKRSKENS